MRVKDMYDDEWAYNHPDAEVRVSWGWNWWEIVDAFRRGERLHVWRAMLRGLKSDDPVLPVVLPIKGL